MTLSALHANTANGLAGAVSPNEIALRALFSAASRVLSYHAAALDAKVGRGSASEGESDAHLRSEHVEYSGEN
jgi:hypothetical protein